MSGVGKRHQCARSEHLLATLVRFFRAVMLFAKRSTLLDCVFSLLVDTPLSYNLRHDLVSETQSDCATVTGNALRPGHRPSPDIVFRPNRRGARIKHEARTVICIPFWSSSGILHKGGHPAWFDCIPLLSSAPVCSIRLWRSRHVPLSRQRPRHPWQQALKHGLSPPV